MVHELLAHHLYGGHEVLGKGSAHQSFRYEINVLGGAYDPEFYFDRVTTLQCVLAARAPREAAQEELEGNLLAHAVYGLASSLRLIGSRARKVVERFFLSHVLHIFGSRHFMPPGT